MKLFRILVGAAVLSSSLAFAETPGADTRLRRIYNDEWKWRVEQFPGLEGPSKPVPDDLSKEDPATQAMRLRHWEDVLHQLDAIPRAELSAEEQVNYDIFRPEIEDAIADEKFRDYEMPANSDSAFWSDFGSTAQRPFKNLTRRIFDTSNAFGGNRNQARIFS